ncbi:MAG: HU family DNA-binding protein [Bacteroidales bacterium]|jgi:predicted histone-like DNA-binding protein|nr:HU family DNA-binding protein [Bacteroidales bacterium]
MAKFNFPYVIVKRIQSIGQTSISKFRRKEFRNGKTSFDVLIRKIIEREGLTRADVIAVVSALEDVIKEEIAEGRSVNVGYLGTFTPYLESKLMTTVTQAEENGGGIIRCRFRPSVDFSEFLKNEVSLKRAITDISGLQS